MYPEPESRPSVQAHCQDFFGRKFLYQERNFKSFKNLPLVKKTRFDISVQLNRN